MNIRAKIILTWVLFLAWAILMYFHFVGAWFLYLVMIYVRQSKPQAPQLPRRLGYFVGFAFILFLVLLLIDGFHPFPSSVVTIGKIIGMVLLIPLVLYGAFVDYKAFKILHDTSV